MGAYFVWTPPGGGPQSLHFDVVTSETPTLGTAVTEHPVERGADVSDHVRVALNQITLEVFVTNEPVNEAPQFATGTVGFAGPVTIDAPGQPPNTPQSLVAKEWFTLPVGVPILGAIVAQEIDVPFVPQAGIQPLPSAQVNPKVLQFGTAFDAKRRTHDILDQLRKTVQLISVIGTTSQYDNMIVQNFTPSRTSEEGTGAKFTIELKEIRLVSSLIVTAPKPSVPRANTPKPKGPQSTTPPPQQKSKSLAKTIEGWLGGAASVPTQAVP